MMNRQKDSSLVAKFWGPSDWVSSNVRVLGAIAVSWCVVWGCTYDPDERCDPDQELYGEALRCVCKLPKVWSPKGCVECPAGEVATPFGCACVEGVPRSPNGTCDVQPATTSANDDATPSSSEAADAQVGCERDASCVDGGDTP